MTLLETIFTVPLLGEKSVACGGCCPVPAEAVILPELEQVPGVRDAEAHWASAEVRVRHAADLNPSILASVLEELSYPATGWRTAPPASE